MPFQRLIEHIKETNDIAAGYITGRLVIDLVHQTVELEQHKGNELSYIELTDNDRIEVRKGNSYVQITRSAALMYQDRIMGCSLYQGLYARVKTKNEEDFKMMTMEKVNLMGLGLSKHGMYHLSFLVKNEEEFNDFMKHFWQGATKELKALSKYREYKQQQNKLELNEFNDMYQNDQVKALETLFQHHVMECDVAKINYNGITADQIYQYHLSNPYGTLLQYLTFFRNEK